MPPIAVPVVGNVNIVSVTFGLLSLEEFEAIANEVGSDKRQTDAARLS